MSLNFFLRSHGLFIAGVCKTEEDEGPSTEEDSQSYNGLGMCKWFNVRMGFGFLSMTNREGVPLDEPVDVFVHQVGRLSPNSVAETIISVKKKQQPRNLDEPCAHLHYKKYLGVWSKYLMKVKYLTSRSEIIPPVFNAV